ncbi:acyltransferase [Pseudocitrobacter sp. 73]|uniref:acyltransferase n=1 Tax=Pseudocitrobacter sp. 73 TaxID=2605731 RepID=UPI0011ECEE1F|nr:acyltransferase [Pseudocitrobacter sp. 73]KAA1049552.1 acyltransferase [Pseudocitrobacter sp. 73]
MITITDIKNYRDELGNIIYYDGPGLTNVKVTFYGQNNKLHINKFSKIKDVALRFDCNNGTCHIGKNGFTGHIRIGHECIVDIGDNVSCTDKCYISTAERSKVKIGNDCMIASSVEIRSDDAHPIFDIESENRINNSEHIIIGEHVWIGARVTLLAGSIIGNGSVIGLGSIVKGCFPNNVIIAGIPARLIKKDIAWERPHLNLTKPYIKDNASAISKSSYWNKTLDINLTE